MMRSRRWLIRAGLLVVAAAMLLPWSHATAQEPPPLGGFQGTAAASGLHVLYAPKNLLPTSPPVDIGSPDALATISSGPSTYARAAVADIGDLLSNPDALFQLAIDDWEAGTIPPWPLRVESTSSVGEPSAESELAPGLEAKVHADAEGSSANSTMPALDAAPLVSIGSMVSNSHTSYGGSTVSVHARSEISDISILDVITIDSVVTDLTAKSDGNDTITDGGTVITGASFLGQPITIDGDGLHVDNNGSAGSDAGALDDLNALLAEAGIRITVSSPVEQDGASAGRLASSGLRIDLELSDETMPLIAALDEAVGAIGPLLPDDLSGLLGVTGVTHIVTIELGRGLVELQAQPGFESDFEFVPPTTSPPTATSTPPSLGNLSTPTTNAPVGPPAAAPAATSPAPEATPAATTVPFTFGTGIGILVLLTLALQPLLGRWVVRSADVILAGSGGAACPREGL